MRAANYSSMNILNINNFTKNNSVTNLDLFSSIIYILINKYTKSNYICIDTIKGTNEFNDVLIGLLNNTLILPCNFNSSIKVYDFIEICKINKIKIFIFDTNKFF